MREIAIIGFGGHARVVAEAIEAAGDRVVGFLDDDAELQGSSWGGLEVIGRPMPDEIVRLGIGSAVIAIGGAKARRELAARLDGAVAWAHVVHPFSWISPRARIEPGAMVMAGAVVQADVSIGRHAIVNTGASVDHDCDVGAFSHIAPGARLCGGVRVGEGALVGVGACAIPGVTIGRDAVVGAGACVVTPVPDGVQVVGVPARPR